MLFKKIFSSRVIKRILIERFSEPIHLNIVSFFVYLFGNYKLKIFFDLILRQHNAYSILKCAEDAKKMNLSTVTLIEFGVASGSGLVNMATIAKKVSKITNIKFNIFGFDTGTGLPAPKNLKDYPNAFQEGDYPIDIQRLKRILPDNVELVLGDVKETVVSFIKKISPEAPIGYIVLDLDYYSSSFGALQVLTHDSDKYLPTVHLYADDIDEFGHSQFCGEEAAIENFNGKNELRKIEKNIFLKHGRLFKKAKWLDKMFKISILDHPNRKGTPRTFVKTLSNPYL